MSLVSLLMNADPPGAEKATPSPAPPDAADEQAPGFAIERPACQTLPVVFASPHSGTRYSAAFLAASRLDLPRLRRSEDSHVDTIFAAAPKLGAPLIKALFPRAYVDPNREPFELDPEMFDTPLPDGVITRSPRIAAGLGTVARVVASGETIYRGLLSFEEIRRRIESCHIPYHRALQALIDETRARFGWALLIDGHSMPSVGGPMDEDRGASRVGFVLGDRHGTACDLRITDHVETILGATGHRIARNIPYAGGYTTAHYGRPAAGVHALQIEINRALYMDEESYQPTTGMAAIIAAITALIDSLAPLCDELGLGRKHDHHSPAQKTGQGIPGL